MPHLYAHALHGALRGAIAVEGEGEGFNILVCLPAVHGAHEVFLLHLEPIIVIKYS